MTPMTPEALDEAYREIEVLRSRLLSFEGEVKDDEDDDTGFLSPMAEQHFLLALDLLNAGMRELKLAKYNLMQNR